MLYLELKQTLEKLGVEVREQILESDVGKAKSGLVRIRERKIALLDKTLSQEEKINHLTRILKEFDLETIYLSPFLRKWVKEFDEKGI